MTAPADGARRTRRAWLLQAGAVAAVALAVRLAGARAAFFGGELVTLDGDSLYHLRRMRLIAEAFPRIPWWDPMIAWPSGAPVPWAAGFDFLGALFIRFGQALGGAPGGDVAAATVCLLLGVAVVVATMDLVQALRPGAPGRRAALAAGVLCAVLPQGVAISRFGRIDHHVAEALAMILLVRWAIDVLPPRRDRSLARRTVWEAAGALVAGGSVLVFTGSPLYVALVVPILLAAAVTAERPTTVGSGGPGLLAGAALAAVFSAPAVAVHGRAFAFGFPSWLQPLLLAGAGAVVLAATVASGRIAPGARRLLPVALGAFGVAGIAVALAPGAASQALAGVREWLLKADPWLRGIDEFQPLLRDPAGPAHGVARFLGATGFAAPLLVVAAPLAGRRGGRARMAGFLWVTVALGALTLLQGRFGRVFVPFLAASGGLALLWLAARCAARARVARLAPLAAALAVALLDPRVRGALGVERDQLPDAAVEAALDLRGRAPGPAPGVQAPWDLANDFLVLAGRPVVATGFGPYPDPAAYWEGVRAYKVGEEELLPWLAGRRVGWVVAGAANLFGRVAGAEARIPFSGRGFDPRWLTSVASAPLLIGGSGVPALGVRHFGHLMPVFASTRTVVGLDGQLPVLWTFEVVAGARIEGKAAPGARVILEIPLTERGRPHTWRAFADAGGDGRWTLTVPLPTDLATPTISTAPGRLRVADAAARPLVIPEAAVRAGGRLEPAPR